MGHNLKHSKAKLFCEIKEIIQAFSHHLILVFQSLLLLFLFKKRRGQPIAWDSLFDKETAIETLADIWSLFIGF